MIGFGSYGLSEPYKLYPQDKREIFIKVTKGKIEVTNDKGMD